MNLTVNGKVSGHGQFAEVSPQDDDAPLHRSCTGNTLHRNCRKPDRYARISGLVTNRRFVARRMQLAAGTAHRKVAAEGMLPLAIAGKSIVVTRNDRRKFRVSQSALIHPSIARHGVHPDAFPANDPEWKRTEEVLRESQEELRRLSAQLLTIQECEQQRIAADLHDGIGQSLNLIKISMESVLLLMQQGAHQQAVESLRQMVCSIRGAMAEMRGITMDLRPAMLDDLGILPTLSWFFREFEAVCRDQKVEKDFCIAEREVPVPLKTTIFRIMQEAINNIVKHAGASRIRVSLKKNGGLLQFSIEDNGQGFALDGVPVRHGSSRGLGLLTMRERARSSGGVFEMKSTPGQGTRISVSWQCMDDAAEHVTEVLHNPHPLQPVTAL